MWPYFPLTVRVLALDRLFQVVAIATFPSSTISGWLLGGCIIDDLTMTNVVRIILIPYVAAVAVAYLDKYPWLLAIVSIQKERHNGSKMVKSRSNGKPNGHFRTLFEHCSRVLRDITRGFEIYSSLEFISNIDCWIRYWPCGSWQHDDDDGVAPWSTWHFVSLW